MTPPSQPNTPPLSPPETDVDFHALRQNRLRDIEAQAAKPLREMPLEAGADAENEIAELPADEPSVAPARAREIEPENDPFVPETPAMRRRAARIEAEKLALENQEKLSPDESKQFERLIKSKRLAPCHWGLLVATLLLTALSIPLIYSASTAIALDQHQGDTNFFLWRQIGYAFVGLGVMICASRIAPERLRAWAWGLYFFAVLGLLATKFSPLGYSMGNVERWIKLGPLTFQFSEIAKIAIIGIMADYWSRASRLSQKSMTPWLVTAVLAGIPIVLTFIQPHLSATLVLLLLPILVAFFAGAPTKHFVSIFVPMFIVAALAIGLCKTHRMPFIADYQQDRIAAKFGGDEASDAQGNNYQSLQGQRAIMRGGLTGVGLGASLYKQGHLPAPHTDFIFAVIAEETGAWGALLLLLLYGAIVFFCFQIGHSASNGFDSLLCVGIGALWAMQVLGNIAVVSGLMPVTGMPLPILTFGGSGLWCALFGLGLVLAVSRAQGES